MNAPLLFIATMVFAVLACSPADASSTQRYRKNAAFSFIHQHTTSSRMPSNVHTFHSNIREEQSFHKPTALASSLEKDPDDHGTTNHDHPLLDDTNTNTNTNANNKSDLSLLLARIRQQTTSFFESKVPPPPNCQLSMTGDVGAIFLYTFLDHYFNHVFDKMLNNPKLISTSNSAIEAMTTSAELSSEISGSIASPTLPVWFDSISSAPFGQIPLSAALPIEHHITYAPIMSTAGVASILLTSSWLLTGYFTQAFRMENTLECSPRRAIWITVITWIGTCMLMVGMAYGSDVYMGCADCGKYTSVGGLTKADADFIFGSVSVLLVWRFILAEFLGYER